MASEPYQATLAGLAMDGTPDAFGVVWGVEDIAGWDSAPVRFDDSETTGRHGGFGPSRLYAPRPLTVPGWAECPDMAAAFAVRDRLHGLMTGALIVHELPAKSVEVVSGGAPRSSWPLDGPRPLVTFQIPLIAHDPFKRALTARTTVVGAGATVAAVNSGTAPADLLVTLTSPGTVVLSTGGVTLRTAELPAGSVIDTGSTSVTGPDGADLFTLVTLPALWPTLPAGGGNVTQAGSAALSIETFDTYA